MSISKSTLGTIVGAALLGLAKSKLGGRNETDPHIVLLNRGTVGDKILIDNVPEDIQGIMEVSDNVRQIFKFPSTAIISFRLEATDVDFPGFPEHEIDEYTEGWKSHYFDENEDLEDDHEDKQDWEDWTDVPDWYVEELVEQKREELMETWRDDCYGIVYRFICRVVETLRHEIEHSEESFQRCKRFIDSRNVYLHISDYDSEYEENEGWVAIEFQIFINSKNPLFAVNFMQDLTQFLDQTDEYGEFDNVSIYQKPGIEKMDYKKETTGPKLRIR